MAKASEERDGKLNYDYVYNKNDEYKKLNVEIMVDGKRLRVIINSDEEVDLADLDKAIAYVNESQLAKMRVDILTECDVYLSVAGAERLLKLERASGTGGASGTSGASADAVKVVG
jgi:hypothetical protein